MAISLSASRSASVGRSHARLDAFLARIRGRPLEDQREQQVAIGLDPVADSVPLLAIPLDNLRRTATLVVAHRQFQRLHKAVDAQLLEPRVVDVEMLETPLAFFA